LCLKAAEIDAFDRSTSCGAATRVRALAKVTVQELQAAIHATASRRAVGGDRCIVPRLNTKRGRRSLCFDQFRTENRFTLFLEVL